MKARKALFIAMMIGAAIHVAASCAAAAGWSEILGWTGTLLLTIAYLNLLQEFISLKKDAEESIKEILKSNAHERAKKTTKRTRKAEPAPQL